MGPGLVILIWLIIAATAAAVWIGCFVLFLVSCWKRWRIAALLSGLALVGMPLAAGALAVLVAIGVGLGFYPPHAYAQEFGESPSEDVRDLRGFCFGFADGGYCHLTFRASAETVERIVAKKNFASISAGEYFEELHAPGPQPPTGPPTKFYLAEHFDRSMASSRACMTFDQASGAVEFTWNGID